MIGFFEAAPADENLLQGPPPFEPFPEVVGISVHLTFARRAYRLAQWFRQRGARVILGGLLLFLVMAIFAALGMQP